MKTYLRVAVIPVFLEEGSPSMDLVAARLVENLREHHGSSIRVETVRPAFVRRFSRPRILGRFGFNADRLLNRMFDYPRFLKRVCGEFDIFHLIDHSYSQLVHVLPQGRTLVTCHDLDTFRSVLEPDLEPRSMAFRAMTTRILDGLRSAAMVACNTNNTRAELLKYSVMPPERLAVIHYGIDPIFSPEPDSKADRALERLLGPKGSDTVELLHVGSTIPRKRIDILLRVFALVRKTYPTAKLIRVGREFTNEQRELVQELNLENAIRAFPRLSPAEIAPFYRRASLTLLTSDREGFGLPIIESMACGTPVVCSDIPATHEAGGDEAEYCPAADISAWSDSVIRMLREREENTEPCTARRNARIARARKFSWIQHAHKVASLYNQIGGESDSAETLMGTIGR